MRNPSSSFSFSLTWQGGYFDPPEETQRRRLKASLAPAPGAAAADATAASQSTRTSLTAVSQAGGRACRRRLGASVAGWQPAGSRLCAATAGWVGGWLVTNGWSTLKPLCVPRPACPAGPVTAGSLLARNEEECVAACGADAACEQWALCTAVGG